MRTHTSKVFLFLLLSLILITPTFVVAQNPPGTGSSGGLNPLGNIDKLEPLLTKILKVFMEFGIAIAALAIVYAGYLFVTAQGKESDINKAKDALLWASVGLGVLLGARAIVSVIQNTVTNLG